MATLATGELYWLADEWEALYRSAVCSGIVGDPRHMAEGGYHVSREDNPPGNYSVIRPLDRKGPADRAAGVDMTMNAADMKLCTSRLVKVFNDRKDPRRKFINAFNGWLGSGEAKRWDCVADAVSWATPDHKWHVHLEVPRACVVTREAAVAMRSALAGQSVADYEEEIDGMKLSDAVKLTTGKGVGYGGSHSTVEGILSSTNFYLLLTRNQLFPKLAELSAQHQAILRSMQGSTVTADTIRDELRRFQYELLANLLGLIGQEIDDQLPDVPSEQVNAALRRVGERVMGQLAPEPAGEVPAGVEPAEVIEPAGESADR